MCRGSLYHKLRICAKAILSYEAIKFAVDGNICRERQIWFP